MAATGVLMAELTSPRARPRTDHLRWPDSRRTTLRPTRPGKSLAPGPHRSALAAWQHARAEGARRCQCWMRTRFARGAALPGSAAARPANLPRLGEGASAPHRTRRHTNSIARRQAPGPPFAWGRPSMRSNAPETPPPRPAHLVPAPDPRSAQVPRQRPHRGWTPPAPGARRGGRDRFLDRSRPRARGGRRVAPLAGRLRRRPSEPAGGGTPRGGREPTSPPIRPCPQLTAECRAAQPRAIPAPDRPPRRLPRRATIAAHRMEASPAAAYSPPRCSRTAAPWPARQTHPRAGSGSTRAAAPTGRAGFRASREQSAPARVHPAAPARPTPTAPAHHDGPRAQRGDPANRRARRRALASRTRARSSRGMKMAFEGSVWSGPNVWFIRGRGLHWENADG